MGLDTNLLLIDAGNTCLKWAIFDGQSLSDQQRYFHSKDQVQSPVSSIIQNFSDMLGKQISIYPSLSIIMVSVLGEEFNQQAKKISLEYGLSLKQIKSVESLANIKNAYDEPHKLGTDRFVAMVGAYSLSNKQKPKKACIIVDSGTATTIDAVDSQGNHLGGLILPGANMCSRSLLQNTKQLGKWGSPENPNKLECHLFATNTMDAIYSASILGLSGAIEQISLNMERELKTKEENIQIEKYLCGGSAEYLMPFMSQTFQLQENLIMLGLIHLSLETGNISNKGY